MGKNRKYFLIISHLIFFLIVSTSLAHAQIQNSWQPLGKTYSIQDLKNLILPPNQWKPYPTVNDPSGFSSVPENVKQAYIQAGEKLLNIKWPPLPATVFLQFKRSGNRSNYERLSFERRENLATLVLAETFERKGRFIDQIINGIWAICEESFWGVPAHLGFQEAGIGLPDVQDPIVDLFAAETAEEMAWIYYLLKPELDNVNPLVAKRIQYETRRRILIPYLQHENWGYLGFEWKKDPEKHRRVNNWNPWVNSNVLAAALVLASDSLRLRIIHKTMASIDNFVIPYPADGGSDEGPDYWGRAAGSLLDYLELLKSASGGKINVFDQPVIKNMGKYIYRMYINYPYYVNYGDADAKYEPDPALLYRFGRDTQDSLLVHFAAYEAQQQNYGQGILNYPFGVLNRALPALFIFKDLKTARPEEPLVRDVWLPDIQVMAARSKAESTDGFYIAAKGGNNGASHNHNDVGNYIVYYNGYPVLIDAGAQTYTAQTFGSRRYELWNNQSAYHNLPDINGMMQHQGVSYTSSDLQYKENQGEASLTMDIAGAYPKEAEVRSWIRTITLNRNKNVEISERYELTTYKAPLVENFLTPLSPDISSPGVVMLYDSTLSKNFKIHYDRKKFRPEVEKVIINDGELTKNGERNGRMYRNWGGILYHIRLISQIHAVKDEFIIKID